MHDRERDLDYVRHVTAHDAVSVYIHVRRRRSASLREAIRALLSLFVRRREPMTQALVNSPSSRSDGMSIADLRAPHGPQVAPCDPDLPCEEPKPCRN